jgi:WD40 repeat protein
MKLTHCSLVDCGPNRTQSRSVSWNASGTYLGLATSDSTVRVWTLDSGGSTSNSNSNSGSGGGGAKEVVSLTGHAGPVRLVQFHPTADTILASVATDDGVGQWDVRNGGKATSMIMAPSSLPQQQPIVSLQWNPVDTHILAVTTRDGTVLLYDVRHVKQPAVTNHSNLVASSIVETCTFDPTGRYLVAGCHTSAVASKSSSRHGMGHLAIWPVQQKPPQTPPQQSVESLLYPAHAGPIYALAFGPVGSNVLVSGGSDAMVGLWHLPTMTCRATVTSRTKWIRSVAVAPNAHIVAVATEEEAIELVDATTAAAAPATPDADGTARNATAPMIGKSACAQSLGLASFGPLRSRGGSGGGGGAEDVAFHPNTNTLSSSYVLACARTDAATPVTIMKLTMGP